MLIKNKIRFFLYLFIRISFRNERLEYARFMQEITDAIIQKQLTTESAIEKLYEIYIDRNQGKLNEVKPDVSFFLF